MENRLNREGIKKYSKRFTKKTLDTFFTSTDQNIYGKDILDLQPIKQVNLFVMKNLFREWQKETAKLKSRYFDYDHKAVKTALTNFMNTLSQHIAIGREDFERLFQQATEETILLIFSPYDFYIHILERNDDAIRLADLKKISKYVKVNKNILDILIDLMDEKGHDELNNSNLGHLLDDVFANIEDTPEDIEVYLTDFTAAVPLKVEDLYVEEGEQEKIEPESAPDQVTADKESERPLEKVDMPEDESKKNETTFQWNIEPKKTLHDELTDGTPVTLADVHEKKKIEDILGSLSINQRFMFINNLFENNEDKFQETIMRIERFSHEKEAFKYLDAEFPHWDHESEEVLEFYEVVSRRLK